MFKKGNAMKLNFTQAPKVTNFAQRAFILHLH